MKNILVLGGTTYDSIIHLDNLPKPEPQTIHYAAFNETIGSTGAGKALNLSKLNVNTILHSILGEDTYGHNIINSLNEEGVNFIYDIDEKGTERHVNFMDINGNRISIFVTQSSQNPILNMERLEELIRTSDIVVLNILNYTKQLIPLCKKYNKPIWTDLHDYDEGNPYHEEYIAAADYIFLSSDNLMNFKPVMENWMSKGKELVVCTHGKDGSTALTKEGQWIETPIVKSYKHKDANGAGDSFFSGYLYGFLKGRSIEECLKLATICAGLCISSEKLSFEGLNEKLLDEEYKKYFGKSSYF